MAHAELVIPKEWVSDDAQYPDAGSEYPDGHVLEHYSWKKVTTNVSNFIMGSPIIDHYGDLIVSKYSSDEVGAQADSSSKSQNRRDMHSHL